jgi:hypothetical protein
MVSAGQMEELVENMSEMQRIFTVSPKVQDEV